MALTLDEMLEVSRRSRAQFEKHLKGLTAEQWDWKPYPECKSVRQTLLHMIGTDTWTLEDLDAEETTPNYDAHLEAAERDYGTVSPENLLIALHDTRARLLVRLTERYGDAALDAPMRLWGATGKLGTQLARLPSEDHYHAGQVAFIRMATDPAWDYYSAIYGGWRPGATLAAEGTVRNSSGGADMCQ